MLQSLTRWLQSLFTPQEIMAGMLALLLGFVLMSFFWQVTMQSRQTAGGDNGPGSGMGRPVASNVEDAADLVQRFRVEPALATGAAHGIAVSERLAWAIKNVPTFVIVRKGGLAVLAVFYLRHYQRVERAIFAHIYQEGMR